MGVALYGGSWADPEAWAERCRPDGCVICTSGRPYRIIGETAHTWITTDAEVALFGYVCVISKAHVVEPFQLPEAERAAFWREAMAIAEALNAALSPVKMNYEIHGNTLPHLHMHLLPRRVDDAFVGRPVDLRETHHRHTAADIEMLSSALGAASDEGL
jgi:diadenosine tetraphosphate (Ap4A) HIT family hydrolase